MKKFLHILLAVLPSLFVGAATAGEINYTYTLPTQYVDNSPIQTGDIEQVRIERGTCGTGNTFGTKIDEIVIPGAATSGKATNVPPGAYCSRGFVKAKGVEAAASNVLATTVAQPAPKPIVLTAASPTAYTLIKQRDALVMLPVGTVPLGTECKQDQFANGKNVVPRAAVTFTGNVQPEVVFADCSPT